MLLKIEILVGQADQSSQNIVLINNSRTPLPTQMLMLFFSSLDNFLQDAY